MIRSFEIHDPTNTSVDWMAKVPALSKPRKFEFKPGLNILWGKNGSGKSTLIKALARLLHCEQGSVPTLSQNSIREMFDRRRSLTDPDMAAFTKAMTLDHDGQGVRYFDPSVAVGLIGGGAGFDDDFFGMGVANVMFKGSAGETTMFRFDKLVAEIIKGDVPDVDRKISASRVNDLWAARVNTAESFLKGSGDLGPPTVLLDEPERSYDIPHQYGIWRFIRALSSKIQFIVASHSFFALRLPEAHYIEMEKGYLTNSLAGLLKLSTDWVDEKPSAEEYATKMKEIETRKPKKKASAK